MTVPALKTIANFAAVPVATALKLMAAKPIITAIALTVLSSPYWVPKAEAGPLAFMACYSSCMIASNAATSGAMLPATQLFCQNLCAPVLMAPSP